MGENGTAIEKYSFRKGGSIAKGNIAMFGWLDEEITG